MKNLGYYNGTYGPLEEMNIPFNDRVHFFGDGVYEFCMVRNYKIFAYEEHIDRMFRGAELLDIKIPYTKEEIYDILCDLIKKVDSPDQFCYWQLTRGTHIRNHTYPDDMQANLWVVLRPGKIKDMEKNVSAITEPDKRFFYCNIKSLNLLPSVMYAQKAEKAGVYETILFREGGRVTECSHSNCNIINKDGVFQTAPTDELILPGIARKHLIEGCRELGIEVSETPFTIEDLMEAQEIIISSTTGPCMICNNVNGTPVGGKAPEKIRALKDYVMNKYIEETK